MAVNPNKIFYGQYDRASWSRLIDVEGVTSASCNVDEQKVTVDGYVKPEVILKAAKTITSCAEIVKKDPKKNGLEQSSNEDLRVDDTSAVGEHLLRAALELH
ncbi:hypothetical protein R1flu_012019 [Riccia fluitans]|uniref:HMA domain-containing protein n=1 Tax=Riccia fluitans TaxID=41844 RepID=A0ABD1ZDK2_9MARC